MLKESDLRREVGMLDMMINALSLELAARQQPDDPEIASGDLVREMQEALEELKRARALKNLLLNAYRDRDRALSSGGHKAAVTKRGPYAGLLPAA